MIKLYILSIQGQNLVTVNGYGNGQYENSSYIKVFDMENDKKLDWKLGVFTQAQEQIHSKEEIKKLEEIGLKSFYIDPWNDDNNNKDALNVLSKLGYYDEYEDDEENIISSTFDGYIFIGEVDRKIAEKLNKEYLNNHYVY